MHLSTKGEFIKWRFKAISASLLQQWSPAFLALQSGGWGVRGDDSAWGAPFAHLHKLSCARSLLPQPSFKWATAWGLGPLFYSMPLKHLPPLNHTRQHNQYYYYYYSCYYALLCIVAATFWYLFHLQQLNEKWDRK